MEPGSYAAEVARIMFEETSGEGQSARRVPDEAQADAVREELRRLGRDAGVRLRTARLDDLVVVARLDAAIWDDDAATMRSKLTPRD